MSTRNVVVASTAANKARKIETSARTWGELKSQREMEDLIVGSVEAIVNPGNVSLRDDDSILPTGDFTLYLTPTKNKAGAISNIDATEIGMAIAEAINKASKMDGQDEAKSLKDELITTIEDFFGVSLDGDADCPECNEALQKAYALGR